MPVSFDQINLPTYPTSLRIVQEEKLAAEILRDYKFLVSTTWWQDILISGVERLKQTSNQPTIKVNMKL